MMDIAYIVKGYIQAGDKEKSTLYVGISPKRAFEYLKWGKRAEVIIEIWEDGNLVKEITQ